MPRAGYFGRLASLDRVTLRDRLGAELFSKVAGPDGPRNRRRVHGTPGPRWFAPDSPIGRVHGDASMFVGGIRALLLQSLHPAAMAGVAGHSGYRGDPWGRLARTSHFLAVTTFGADEDARRRSRGSRRSTTGCTGRMPDGAPYSAADPHLLAWVHVAEIDSFLRAHQRYGARPLDQAGCDEYVAADRRGRRASSACSTRRRPRRSCARRSRRTAPELAGTAEAREAVRFLLLHPDLPAGGAARPTSCSPRPPSGCCRAGPAPAATAAAAVPGDQPCARRRGHPDDPVGDGLGHAEARELHQATQR